MKFGNDKSPNTASFILDPSERDTRPRIAHVTGLGFIEGSAVVIERNGDKLLFEGEVEREVEDRNSGFAITTKQKFKTTKDLRLEDIQSIDITDESGRSLGRAALWGVAGGLALGPLGLFAGAVLGARKKRYKSYLVFQIKHGNSIQYPIVFGGANQKEVRAYYEHLINMIK